jgi:hypothetical protein
MKHLGGNAYDTPETSRFVASALISEKRKEGKPFHDRAALLAIRGVNG